jgi:class 3 adenylate cyclase
MGRRLFRKGELLLVVLKLLERRPMPEGEILDELHELLGLEYRLTPASVLAALEALEAEGLVEATALRGSAVYKIAGKGIEAIGQHADAAVLGRISRASESGQAPERSASQVLERVAVLFTDLVGSTELLDRLGDDAAHHLRRRHFALLRHAVREHGGREVKSLGDGLMVVFGSARPAVACGLAMQRAVAAHEDSLLLRVGIASGETVREDGDYFGRPVIVARRLCDAAGDGDMLVSEPPPGHVAGSRAESLEPLVLKGLSEPVAASAMRPGPLPQIA